MPENKRVRIEPHLEEYLKSHAQRVLGKKPGEVTTAELSTLTNALLYEHKLAKDAINKISLPNVFSWLSSLVPALGKVIPLQLPQEPPALPKQQEDFSFDADLGDLYEDAA